MLAHSSLATLDALAMATILASCVVFEFALDRVRWRWWLLTGLLGGLALAAKFSALLLLPAFAIRLVIASWQGSLKTWVAAGRYVILCIVAMVVMWACYGFSRVSIASSWQSGPHVAGQTFDQIMTDRHVPQWARPILTEWRLPLADAITGICRVAGVSERGRIAFINGRIYPQGTPFFNFWVFLWKTPSVLLAGLIGGIVVSSKDLIRRGLALCQPASAPSGQPLISCYWPLYYFAFFFVMPFFARNAFAYRYLLPCVPFAIVLAAAALSRVIENARSHLLTAVLSLMILAPLLVTPGQLAFFNMPSRLAGQPYQLAADSNLDWGQGLYALRQAVTRLMDQGVAPPLLA
ncbi:MAG: glycosyltransferase family 39 protein, partial [Candidatus Sumerlaeota bacterium]|nr:glycosyltransferase family 39 protein [Candidatus Sumerlaeota bacterium]